MLSVSGKVADRLRAALAAVLQGTSPAVDRLSYARASVRLQLPDEQDGATLLFDRTPPAVLPHDEPGEIELRMTSTVASRLLDGSLTVTAALASGAIDATGPVRRFLEVAPILQELLAPGAVRAPATDAAWRLSPELLAIATEDLQKSFGRARILQGVDLAIPEGVISVVLGPSGTGKSVLLQHITGLLRPDSGDVLIRGRRLSRMSRTELLALRREIGVMFQDGALFSAMSVFDNVAFPLRRHTDLNDAEVREAVMERLEAVGLAHAASNAPSDLSGGMKKRVGLARALVMEPSIVLCDEPDSGLDPVRTALLGDLLAEQHAEFGGTMVVITHNIALAKAIGEHVSILWQGKVLESGMRDQILASDSEFVQQFLAGETRGPLSMDA